MFANKFVLKHKQIQVDYTVGITPGLVALTYKDGSDVKSFKTSEITTDKRLFGAFVSIPLLMTIDTQRFRGSRNSCRSFRSQMNGSRSLIVSSSRAAQMVTPRSECEPAGNGR
jgi:hypothetical protein